MSPEIDVLAIFQQLGISLGLGLLVGLQRERSEPQLAGFRTFALVTVSGTVAALLARGFGSGVLAASILALAGLLVVGNFAKFRVGPVDPGLTTEAAMLLMFGVGALLAVAPAAIGIAVGAGTAVLLHLKPELHRLAGRLGDTDFRAIMQFALIWLVILPVLPDRAYDPFGVLNPHRIWLMVVLIVGIGLAGYLVYKVLGGRAGALLAGLLGGVISSTATTVTYARRDRAGGISQQAASLVLVIASAVVFLRLLLEVAVVAPSFLRQAVWPLGALFLALAATAAAIAYRADGDAGAMPAHGNPSELKAALGFGAIYALVLLAVAAAKEHLGPSGLYGVAALSGLTDMDAITLSTSQMVANGQLAPRLGARLILLASLANLVFKAGVVAFLGSRALGRRIAVAFGLVVLLGAALLAL